MSNNLKQELLIHRKYMDQEKRVCRQIARIMDRAIDVQLGRIKMDKFDVEKAQLLTKMVQLNQDMRATLDTEKHITVKMKDTPSEYSVFEGEVDKIAQRLESRMPWELADEGFDD